MKKNLHLSLVAASLLWACSGHLVVTPILAKEVQRCCGRWNRRFHEFQRWQWHRTRIGWQCGRRRNYDFCRIQRYRWGHCEGGGFAG